MPPSRSLLVAGTPVSHVLSPVLSGFSSCTAAEGIKESYGAHCTINPAKVTGVYERQDGSWTKTSVKKIDYKKRLISVAAGGRWSTTGVGYTYSRVWVPKLVEVRRRTRRRFLVGSGRALERRN